MIKIENLSVYYGKKCALSIPKLDFESGKLHCLLGRNGSGKSTLLKSILGLQSFFGTILVDELNMRKIPNNERAKKFAYLPQSVPIPKMTVETLVSHGRYSRLSFSKVLSKADILAVNNAIQIMGIEDFRFRFLEELSYGERQKAYLAMVIAQESDYILLDEPLTYLDIPYQIELCNLLKKLVSSGKGILFASHDIPQAFTYSDSVSILKMGELCGHGRPDSKELYTDCLENAMGFRLIIQEKKECLYSYELAKKKS